MPAMPEGVEEGIRRGIYKLAPAAERRNAGRASTCSAAARSCARRCARRSCSPSDGVAADVWSVTSYTELRRDALACERWNMLHPDEPTAPVRISASVSPDEPWPVDRRQRLHEDASPIRSRASSRPVSSRSAPTASAAATRARRCAASSRSTPRDHRRRARRAGAPRHHSRRCRRRRDRDSTSTPSGRPRHPLTIVATAVVDCVRPLGDPARMWIEPVALEGRYVRLEPLSPAHVPALWAATAPELYRFKPYALSNEDDMRRFVGAAPAHAGRRRGTRVRHHRSRHRRGGGIEQLFRRRCAASADRDRRDLGRPGPPAHAGQHRGEVPDAGPRLRTLGCRASSSRPTAEREVRAALCGSAPSRRASSATTW